ncbi:hypothetical protein DSO57_1001402 [Entomophthora muscae]|uniref:Uncharacterized protein n=1 Tax=Entomophthora muscae TaxID=34485 RepID=A0ACC2TJS7_9FUNG|nr:hypothetical protein DSO57_1001402 [Entomophthora muscae]
MKTSQHLNALLEKLNTQLPNIVGEILDLRGASQTWCQDVTCHILEVEHYVEDAARQEATHQEETGCCTSKLADARSKLEALTKEFNDFSQTNQSELNRLKDLAHAEEANIVNLKDNFVKYNNHLQLALEEKLAMFCKETEEAILLVSQTPAAQGITTAVPEMDEIQCQIDSLTISNNDAFLEINEVNKRHEQQQAALQAEICDLCNTMQ